MATGRFRFRPPTAIQRAVAGSGTTISSPGAQTGLCGGDVVISGFITPGFPAGNYVYFKNRPGFRNLVNGVDPAFCGAFSCCGGNRVR